MEVEASACRSTSGIDDFRLLNGSDPKIAAPPRKIKIIVKPFKKATEVVPALPPATLSSEDSMKLKLETTKRKLEQRYGEEAEKKAKKKIQRMDFADPKKNVGGGGCSKVKAGDVRERLLAKMKKMKQKNKKPKYTLYSNKIVMENSFNDHEVSFDCIP